jgi:hypothetical protein
MRRSKKVWVSKEEWATNPSIDTCSSVLEVNPESLSLHLDDYICVEIPADQPPPLILQKGKKKRDWFKFVDGDFGLGLAVGMGISALLLIVLYFIIKK